MHKIGCSVGRLLSIIAILLLAFGRPALAAAPAAPSHLTVVALSATEFQLTWHDNSYNEERFGVWICPPPSPFLKRCTMIAELPPNTTTYNAPLPLGGCYFFHVCAGNANGWSEGSNEVAAVFLDVPSLTAQAASANRIELAWQDDSRCESGYVIQRGIVIPGSIATRLMQLESLPPNTATYTDTTMAQGETYLYRVLVFYEETRTVEKLSNIVSIIAYAPENLRATPVTAGRIDLTWDDGLANEDGYTLVRSAYSFLTGWGAWLSVCDVPADTTSYSDIGVVAGTLYRYRVRAYMGNALSAWSNTASAMAVNVPPSSPTNLTANRISSSRIDLVWQDSAINETGFKIERKPPGGSYGQVAQVGADTTTYSNTGLDPATAYCYRVRAYNSAGNSAYSNEACATTSAVPPIEPSYLAIAAVTSDQIDITWADNSDDEIGFKIGRRKPEDRAFVQIAVVGANTTAYSSTGLNPGAQYCYLVLAYNAAGNSDPSNEACATTLAGGGPLVSAPNAPDTLSAVAPSASRIDLSWNDTSDDEAGFYIERKPETGSYDQIAVVVADAMSYADTDVSASSTYCYRVRAYNSAGESAYCDEACAATWGVVPNAPDNLDASSVSSSRTDLTWQDASSNETGFRIERRPQGGSYTQIAMVTANVAGYVDTGLSAGAMYCYRVRAYNATGDSGYCAEACAIALAPNLAASAAGSTRIDLSWNDALTYEDGYAVQRRTYQAGAGWQGWVGIATVGPSVTNYADTAIASGGLYQYRVRAYTSNAESAWSNTATASATDLPPTAPSHSTAVAVSSTQVDLEWQDNADTEEGFKIERAVGGGAFAQICVVGANVTGYSDPGRTVDTRYCYRVRAFNAGGDSDASNEACAMTADNTPPDPDPMTWDVAPHAVGPESVAMEATAASDPSGVEYYFEETSGNPGGDDSGWQGNPTFADTGLTPGTEYCYRVTARDQSLFPNQTGWSSLVCASTGTLGDINGDGVVDLIDVLMLYRHTRGVLALTLGQLAAADIDGDGDVDLADAEALAGIVFSS